MAVSHGMFLFFFLRYWRTLYVSGLCWKIHVVCTFRNWPEHTARRHEAYLAADLPHLHPRQLQLAIPRQEHAMRTHYAHANCSIITIMAYYLSILTNQLSSLHTYFAFIQTLWFSEVFICVQILLPRYFIARKKIHWHACTKNADQTQISSSTYNTRSLHRVSP